MGAVSDTRTLQSSSAIHAQSPDHPSVPGAGYRHAEVRDLVGRNVAALVKAPAGRAGRPSESLTLEQAQEPLRIPACTPMWCSR